MDKPKQTLSGLEQEPVVMFGCTWTELMSILRVAGVKAFFGILLSMFIFTLVGVPGVFVFILGIIFGGATFGCFAYLAIKKAGNIRSGKPLFYEKHLNTYKTKFFQPPKYYGRERNIRK